jgi:hypothetical protein
MHPKRIANKDATCPSASRADVRLLLEACWAQGAWIELGGNGHYKVWSPDKAQRMVSIPNTPSGYRTLRNVRSLLRRSGLDPAYLKKR